MNARSRSRDDDLDRAAPSRDSRSRSRSRDAVQEHSQEADSWAARSRSRDDDHDSVERDILDLAPLSSTVELQTDNSSVGYCTDDLDTSDTFLQLVRASVAEYIPTSTNMPWNRDDAQVVWQGFTVGCFFIGVSDGCTIHDFKVDGTTDLLSEEELRLHEQDVIEADGNEISSFAKHDVFEEVWKQSTPIDSKLLDCVFVRKWKRKQDGSKVLKCRLCARGFMDAQLPYLNTYASTASRLTQRLIVSLAVVYNFDLRTMDISTAFLQGFSYEFMDQILKELKVPRNQIAREVFISVPGNVWFHLKKLGFQGDDSGQWVLRLKKAMYGLADAPQMWQYALRWTLSQLGGIASSMDECFLFW
eukprot:2987292-Amphidinium_carterae.1